MFCTQCGVKNTDEAKFCADCGHRLRTSEQARQDMETAPISEPVQVDTLLDQAYELYDAGSVDQAMELCRTALRMNSESVTARSLLATIYEKKGNLDAAIRQMERIVEMNPESIADVNRLEDLRKRLVDLESDTPVAEPVLTARISEFIDRNRLATAAVSGGVIIVLLAALVLSLRGGAPPADMVVQTPPLPPPGVVQTSPSESVFGVPSVPAPSRGSLFEGLGLDTTPAPVRDAQPTPAPARAPAASPQPAPAPPSPAPVTTQPQPSEPSASEPRIVITRTPTAGNNTGGTAPAPATAATTGRDLQRLAMDYQNQGDRENAIIYYRRAIEAYRQEAATEGGAFEAQQGIRSCRAALSLLGESG